MKKLFLISALCLILTEKAFAELIEFNNCYTDYHQDWESNKKKSSILDRTVTINLDSMILTTTVMRSKEQVEEWNKKIKREFAQMRQIYQNTYKIKNYAAGIITASYRSYQTLGYNEYTIYFFINENKYILKIVSYDENDKSTKDFYAKDINHICKKVKSSSSSDGTAGSSGTAFFINSKGYLLTNNHVVEGCELQQVKYNDKDYEAKIIATDKTLDLALMKIEAKPKNYLKFSESSLEKLQKVYVAGYPFGKGLSDDLKISSGIVSSVKGYDDNSNEFQVDAPINPGNSGGPIVDDTGELIGIAVAGFAKDKAEGINFGIKSLSAITFLKTNKIDPETSYMTFAMNNKKLLQLLEESTVYTYCN
jgi:S1-C subfamily serine protease